MKTIGVWLTKLAVIRQLRPTTAGIICHLGQVMAGYVV